MARKYNWVIFIVLLTIWSPAALATGNKALSEHDLLELLTGDVYNGRIAELVRKRGISFVPTIDELDSLRRAGADSTLLRAVEGARHPTLQLPVNVPSPAAHLPERVAKSNPARQVRVAEVPRIDGQRDVVRNCKAGHMYLAHNIVGDPQACIIGSLECCGTPTMGSGVSGGMSGAW
jgi:hypothetical protein